MGGMIEASRLCVSRRFSCGEASRRRERVPAATWRQYLGLLFDELGHNLIEVGHQASPSVLPAKRER